MRRGTSPDGVHRGRRRLLVVVGAIAVVIAVVAAWFVLGSERAEESSEDAARRRLGAGNGSGPAVSGAPAPGLYRYEGSGTEEQSVPPLTEQQGPRMPATVVMQPDGCWVLQVDLNTQHWQNWTFCNAGGELREKQGTTFTRRKFGTLDVENTSTLTCEPATVILAASDPPGTARQRYCTGRGTFVPAETQIRGPMTVVGPERIDVGGRPVPTTHVRQELTLSGGQTGTETTDLWFADNGLLVRRHYRVSVDTESPIGRVHYTEDSRITLQATTPT